MEDESITVQKAGRKYKKKYQNRKQKYRLWMDVGGSGWYKGGELDFMESVISSNHLSSFLLSNIPSITLDLS